MFGTNVAIWEWTPIIHPLCTVCIHVLLHSLRQSDVKLCCCSFGTFMTGNKMSEKIAPAVLNVSPSRSNFSNLIWPSYLHNRSGKTHTSVHFGVSDEYDSLHKPLITRRPLCLCPAGEEEVSNLAATERLWRPYSRADTPPQTPIYWMCRETLHMSMWTTAWPCNEDKREELQKQIYHFYQPQYRRSSSNGKVSWSTTSLQVCCSMKIAGYQSVNCLILWCCEIVIFLEMVKVTQRSHAVATLVQNKTFQQLGYWMVHNEVLTIMLPRGWTLTTHDIWIWLSNN